MASPFFTGSFYFTAAVESSLPVFRILERLLGGVGAVGCSCRPLPQRTSALAWAAQETPGRSLAPGAEIVGDRVGKVGQGLAVDHGAGVVVDQGLGEILAVEVGNQIACGRQLGLAVLGIVSVGGENMDGVPIEQPAGGAHNALSPVSGESGSGHLDYASLLHPLQHPLRALLQNGVALRMSKDGSDSLVAQLGEAFVDLLRDAVVAQFDQEIVRALDGVVGRAGEDVLQIVVGQMEVTAQGDSGRLADQGAQVLDETRKIRPVVVVTRVGVGGDHGVLDAIVSGHAAHGGGGLPVPGAIVNLGENVTVDIDHGA